MRIVYALILFLLLGVLFAFAVQNTQVSEIFFLNWKVSTPLAALAVGFYLLGMISGAPVLGLFRGLLRRVETHEAHSSR